MFRIFGLAILASASAFPIPLSSAGAPKSNTSRIETEGLIDAEIDSVWSSFTTKHGIEAWMVPHAEIDLKVGGKMRTHYNPKGVLGDAGTIENTILSFDPKRMLSIKISKTPAKFPFPNAYQATWSVLYFDAVSPSQTRVKIVMQGYGDNEESQKLRQFFVKGNAFTLTKLKEHFEKKATGE
jgi:uncharacterized protein YndB with AHSA1/START domain